MTKYNLIRTGMVQVTHMVEVEAESREEARRKANEGEWSFDYGIPFSDLEGSDVEWENPPDWEMEVVDDEEPAL